jgi:signal transduction histidine kinase
MEDLSLHILDIVENSLAACASRVEITVVDAPEEDLVSVEIVDNGRGMDRDTVDKALDPFFTTKSVRKVGLGLSLLAQAARESGGDFELESQEGEGTRIKASFQHSHPDRKPLGDIDETMKVLRAANPEVEFVYNLKKRT